MGGQLGTYDRVLQNQANAFGTTVDELEQGIEEAQLAAARQKPQRAPRDEDDFSQNGMLKKDHKRTATPVARPEPAAPPTPRARSSCRTSSSRRTPDDRTIRRRRRRAAQLRR